MNRICCICKIDKPITDFSKDKHDKTGYTYSCKPCRMIRHNEWRKNNPIRIKELNDKNKQVRKQYYNDPINKRRYNLLRIKREFGMEAHEYHNLELSQNGKCAICGDDEKSKRNKNLSIDHCHETNKVRGLLCTNCNRAIGLLKDNIQILEKAINYLNKYNLNENKPTVTL